MSLEHIFYVSQSIAAVAVIASLLYLSQQVRQSERVQRATMQQARADRITQATLALADPKLAHVYQKAAAGDVELTRDEFAQWMLMCRGLFLGGEDSYLQHKAGMLSEAAFDSFVAGFKFYLSMAAVRAAWRLSERQMSSEFRSFANALLTQTSIAQNADAYFEWQQLMAHEQKGSPIPRSLH